MTALTTSLKHLSLGEEWYKEVFPRLLVLEISKVVVETMKSLRKEEQARFLGTSV
tara:strand:+ start:629 stop:793 length:165 start_codon:yes stop_codon:yes gene_type:complete